MLRRLLAQAAFYTAVAWKRQSLDPVGKGDLRTLAHVAPRLNLPGEAPGGEKYRLDCRTCSVPMMWEASGFVCPECGKRVPPSIAARAFQEAALAFLQVAESLDDLDSNPVGVPDGSE